MLRGIAYLTGSGICHRDIKPSNVLVANVVTPPRVNIALFVDELESDYNEKKNELDIYKNKTIQELWLEELDNFEILYNKYYNNKITALSESTIKKSKNQSKN